MATYNKFETFVGDLGLRVHDLNADLLKVYLTNVAPSADLASVAADIAGLATANGYTAGGEDILNAFSEAGGTGTLTATKVVWTASGGTIGPFQYAVLYNDTQAVPLDPLIAWWDYGSALTLKAGESFKVEFSTSIFTIA